MNIEARRRKLLQQTTHGGVYDEQLWQSGIVCSRSRHDLHLPHIFNYSLITFCKHFCTTFSKCRANIVQISLYFQIFFFSLKIYHLRRKSPKHKINSIRINLRGPQGQLMRVKIASGLESSWMYCILSMRG
jgi:hypothetical protein